MSYIIAFLLLTVPQGFLHLSLTSEGKCFDLFLPLQLIEYADIFMESEGGLDELLKEAELYIGDTLIDIYTEEDKLLMVIVGKNDILERGEKCLKWLCLKIEDKKEGDVTIKIPIWAFNVLSKFGVDTMGELDATFLYTLVESIEEMGGGRYKFLEIRDVESSIDIYIE